MSGIAGCVWISCVTALVLSSQCPQILTERAYLCGCVPRLSYMLLMLWGCLAGVGSGLSAVFTENVWLYPVSV